MKRALASVGVAATLICGSAAPALAADNPIDTKITYVSSVTTPAPSPKTSETKLAMTGTYAGVLAVLAPLIAAIGTIAHIASRKEDN